MNGYRLTIEDDPDPQEVKTVLENLKAYNLARVGYRDDRRLAVFLRDQNDHIIGGITGWTYWDWLEIELLWIREDLRGSGYGKRLLEAAEEQAMARGCDQVLLDTFSFQATDFYKSQGYDIFGTLDGFAGKHKRFYLRKQLKTGQAHRENRSGNT